MDKKLGSPFHKEVDDPDEVKQVKIASAGHDSKRGSNHQILGGVSTNSFFNSIGFCGNSDKD